uniref:Uncharacterized protein n=1 Tax=Arundo donax TaxID=35708 RepID=A0A0A9H597_ARUDO
MIFARPGPFPSMLSAVHWNYWLCTLFQEGRLVTIALR